MSAYPARLTIALQKNGRLADTSLNLVRDAGLRFVKGHSDLLYRVENYPIDLLRVRDDDIPTLVADGVADLGVVGLNVLEEHPVGARRAETVMPLGFGRCSLKIAAPVGSPHIQTPALEGTRIATSYPHLLQRFLDARGICAEIVELRGAVEVAPRIGLAQAICDLVSTGATLEANGLTAGETVLDSEAVLIRSPRTLAEPLARLAQNVINRLRGVTTSQGAKYVLMNAPRDAVAAITAILPGAGAPTVTPLASDPDTVAVHAVCQESVFWETLEKLKAAGASAILVMPIEKMM